MNIKAFLQDILPIKRKSSADWVLPAMIGLGVGIAAGIGVGMLYAPVTGEETRLKLRERADRVKAKAGEIAERARSRVPASLEPSQLGRPS
jgi:hypothetical protein